MTVLGWEDPRGLDDNAVPLVTVLPSGERVPRDAAAANELDKREGSLMWPERFGRTELARIKAELGPYLASGRLQQSPVPAKGGIFDRSWWRVYGPGDFGEASNKFPVERARAKSPDLARDAMRSCSTWRGDEAARSRPAKNFLPHQPVAGQPPANSLPVARALSRPAMD